MFLELCAVEFDTITKIGIDEDIHEMETEKEHQERERKQGVLEVRFGNGNWSKISTSPRRGARF